MSLDNGRVSPGTERRGPRAAPAAIPLLACAAGIASGGIVAGLATAAAGLVAVALLVAIAGRQRPMTAPVVACLLFAAAGMLAARRETIAERATELALERFASERFVIIEAEADGTWEPTSGGARMIVPAFSIEQEGLRGSFEVPLALYASALPRGSGDRIRAEGILRRPPSGRWYLSIKSTRLVSWVDAPRRWNPRSWNRRMNLALARLAREAPEYARPVAVARALALGRKEALTEEIRDDYRAGGTYHLLVFSGLQITLAAALLLVLVRLLRRPRIADAALLCMASLAPPFAGFEPSVTRASCMIGLYSVSRFLHRPTPVDNLLFISAIFRLFVHPGELVEAGFLLTYSATGGLIYGARFIAARTTSRTIRAFAIGLGPEVLTLPLTALYFHRYVLGGSLITALLAPVVAAMLGTSALASVIALLSPYHAIPAIELLGVLDRIAIAINGLIRIVPGASGEVIGPPAWSVAVALVSAVLLAGTSARRRGIAAFAIVLLPIAAIPVRELAASRGRLAMAVVEVLDVGQGDAILVRDSDTAVLIDGGGAPDDPSFGRRRVVPLLLERGVRHLDAVAMSHPDEDHCGGLRSLLPAMSTSELWISARHVASPCTRDLLEIARGRAVRPRLVRDGERIRIGAMRFDVILARLRYKRATMNNSSVVYRVDMGTMRVLLAGDIEKEAERTLAEEEAPRIAAEVLKVAHHGASNSASDEFLEAVAPRIGLISCGPDNRFGHPHASTLGRLAAHQVLIWRTDRSGSIAVATHGRRLRVIPVGSKADEN